MFHKQNAHSSQEWFTRWCPPHARHIHAICVQVHRAKPSGLCLAWLPIAVASNCTQIVSSQQQQNWLHFAQRCCCVICHQRTCASLVCCLCGETDSLYILQSNTLLYILQTHSGWGQQSKHIHVLYVMLLALLTQSTAQKVATITVGHVNDADSAYHA